MDVLTNFFVVHISQYIFTCIKSSHCRKCPGDGPHASTAGYLGLIPLWGTKILWITWHGQRVGRKITTLYTLNLHNITCQLPLNKKGETVITVQKLPQWPFQVLALVVKIPPANAGDIREHGLDTWIRKIPWRREWEPTPVFLPGESHGERNLMGYSPWGHKELDMTEVT